jgi:hypothetical protein
VNYYGTGAFFTSQGTTPTVVTLYFRTAINSFGMLYSSSNGAFELSNGDTGVLAPRTFPNAGFFGITSSAFFDAIQIRIFGAGIDFDNVSFGVARTSAVPEPTSTVLLALGLLGVFAIRRRKILQIPS